MPTIKPTAYTVYPDGYDQMIHSDKDLWTMRVELTDEEKGLWAVRHRGRCYSWTEPPDLEPQPSSRTGEWIALYRHSLDRALRLAEHVVPLLSLNGYTAQGASDAVASRLAKETK